MFASSRAALSTVSWQYLALLSSQNESDTSVSRRCPVSRRHPHCDRLPSSWYTIRGCWLRDAGSKTHISGLSHQRRRLKDQNNCSVKPASRFLTHVTHTTAHSVTYLWLSVGFVSPMARESMLHYSEMFYLYTFYLTIFILLAPTLHRHHTVSGLKL